MTLRTIQGENIALGLSSNMPDAFDGQGDTFWRITPLQRNVFAEVDLSSRRLIGQVRVLTRGGSPEEFAENSIRGYAVETSDDGIHFVGVRTLTGIADFEQTKATFTPLVTRFVRVVAIDINPIRNTEIAEIQVFGEGFAPSGQWLSEPLDLGRPDRKNFDRVRWSGQTPEGTAIALRFRSSDDSLTWSDWSAPVTERDAPLIVPEPRRWLQYRAEMVSQFEDAGPAARHPDGRLRRGGARLAGHRLGSCRRGGTGTGHAVHLHPGSRLRRRRLGHRAGAYRHTQPRTGRRDRAARWGRVGRDHRLG